MQHHWFSSWLMQLTICWMSETNFDKQQRVQNTFACIVTSCKRSDHITPVLPDLHWLPIRSRLHCGHIASTSGHNRHFLGHWFQIISWRMTCDRLYDLVAMKGPRRLKGWVSICALLNQSRTVYHLQSDIVILSTLFWKHLKTHIYIEHVVN